MALGVSVLVTIVDGPISRRASPAPGMPSQLAMLLAALTALRMSSVTTAAPCPSHKRSAGIGT